MLHAFDTPHIFGFFFSLTAGSFLFAEALGGNPEGDLGPLAGTSMSFPLEIF